MNSKKKKKGEKYNFIPPYPGNLGKVYYGFLYWSLKTETDIAFSDINLFLKENAS